MLNVETKYYKVHVIIVMCFLQRVSQKVIFSQGTFYPRMKWLLISNITQSDYFKETFFKETFSKKLFSKKLFQSNFFKVTFSN